MKNALILLAGGKGKRLKSKDPKQFLKIDNENLIEFFLKNLDRTIFDIIIIAISNINKKKFLHSIQKKFNQHNIVFSISGKTRQTSTKNSLEVLKKYKPKNVLIHDSARPLTSNKLIKKIISKLKNNKSCIPFTTHNDLLKSKKGMQIYPNDIISIQTPQGFNFQVIYKAHNKIKHINSKDDSSILESQGIKLKLIKGEITNIKITYKDDLKYFKKLKFRDFKSGIGYDIHKINLKSKKKLTLCGVKISHPPLIGHSDADVGYHAVCDSILGALSMRDIGYHFKNTNLKWKNANSKIFINFCHQELLRQDYQIVNLDINFICETPNINKISSLMKKNLSKLLNISSKIISIKATTNEKIGFIGNGEGIAAQSIVQISNV